MGALHESEKLRLGLLVLLSNMGWVAFSLGRVNEGRLDGEMRKYPCGCKKVQGGKEGLLVMERA